MKFFRLVFALVAISSVSMVLLIGSGSSFRALAQDSATPAASPASSYPAVNVVQQVGPAVVTVINEQVANGPGSGSSQQPSGSTGSGSAVPVGSGTGFIIDQQGDIVTNWHVVDQGQ